jgi:hypothetical protein
MTIPRLSISLKGVFEFGQAYVALSRATELKNLKLTGFHKRAFMAHPRVKLFYKLLVESSGDAGGEMLFPPTSTTCRIKTEPKKVSFFSESGTAATVLTPEQLQIVENNRQRAIILRKQKENEMKQANDSFL